MLHKFQLSQYLKKTKHTGERSIHISMCLKLPQMKVTLFIKIRKTCRVQKIKTLKKNIYNLFRTSHVCCKTLQKIQEHSNVEK